MRLDYPQLREAPLRETLQKLGYRVRVRNGIMSARHKEPPLIHISFFWTGHPRNPRTLIHAHEDNLGVHYREACVQSSPILWDAVHEVLREYKRIAANHVEAGASR